MLKKFAAILALMLIPIFAQAQADSFPFLGVVKGGGVNVRAGLNENFEKLLRLPAGRDVVVQGESFHWYKIRLPRAAAVYVSDKYVSDSSDGSGEITADRVNVRCGMDVNRTPLGQLKLGTIVKLLGHAPGWYRIEPTEELSGWVAEQFVDFKSGDISSYTETPGASPTAVVKITGEPKQFTVSLGASATVTKNIPADPAPLAEYQGILKAVAGAGVNPETEYVLWINGQPEYDIKDFKLILKPFFNYAVKVRGIATKDPAFDHPVLDCDSLELIL
ncbi:MAG: SH3 domain-containing protein [Candidatus Omnitrophica bacterium]|nr:SH3 domain-containing protein [Candidatus Omnitrophota bacterium]